MRFWAVCAWETTCWCNVSQLWLLFRKLLKQQRTFEYAPCLSWIVVSICTKFRQRSLVNTLSGSANLWFCDIFFAAWQHSIRESKFEICQQSLASAVQQIKDSEQTLQQVVTKLNESVRTIAAKDERFVNRVSGFLCCVPACSSWLQFGTFGARPTHVSTAVNRFSGGHF